MHDRENKNFSIACMSSVEIYCDNYREGIKILAADANRWILNWEVPIEMFARLSLRVMELFDISDIKINVTSSQANE